MAPTACTTGPSRRQSAFDTTFNYKTDNPKGARPDADRDSLQLRADHDLLWTKEARSGVQFSPVAPEVRSHGYLICTEPVSGQKYWHGSDAITNLYTTWLRPKALVKAITELDDAQRSLYLDPPYTIGSAMIWPVRKSHPYTMNRARVRRQIADRMDLTFECIRRHYADDGKNPLSQVISNYKYFFDIFGTFEKFVEFFHFQDLVSVKKGSIDFFLPFDDFKRHAAPASKYEYTEYRANVLQFIDKRRQRMADWVEEHLSDIPVIR
ncbi:hypothetical protein QE394_001776 [Arthrobacter sp. SORGH_AS 212]|uniref:DUF6994 family protein n=1 Tax=Pseudarthrobacter sp. SORGH_AS 212 TaxID=3041777 RepID=UPI00277E6E92|nr:hypothetical protein [Arthrobacter sp. SORGH_AS_0212]